MNELKLISADSHVNEPGDLWVERIDNQFRDRAPRVVENPPGLKPGAYLTLEGIPPIHLAQGMGAGKKPDELPQFFQASTYNDRRAGGWDPAERIKDMDLDGVEADVIYTTLGFRQFWLTDAGLQRACFRVYNDWLADYCAYAPKRLAGLRVAHTFEGAAERAEGVLLIRDRPTERRRPTTRGSRRSPRQAATRRRCCAPWHAARPSRHSRIQ